jgi:hypothetical protein
VCQLCIEGGSQAEAAQTETREDAVIRYKEELAQQRKKTMEEQGEAVAAVTSRQRREKERKAEMERGKDKAL